MPTITNNIDISFNLTVWRLINEQASVEGITSKMNTHMSVWRRNPGPAQSSTPAVRFIDWEWMAADTVYVTWAATDDPNAAICRTYVFPHLKGVKKRNNVDDAYNRAMKGI